MYANSISESSKIYQKEKFDFFFLKILFLQKSFKVPFFMKTMANLGWTVSGE